MSNIWTYLFYSFLYVFICFSLILVRTLIKLKAKFNKNKKYTEQNYERNTFVFAPIFHELNSEIWDFFYVHKRPISLKYCSQICLNLC